MIQSINETVANKVLGLRGRHTTIYNAYAEVRTSVRRCIGHDMYVSPFTDYMQLLPRLDPGKCLVDRKDTAIVRSLRF